MYVCFIVTLLVTFLGKWQLVWSLFVPTCDMCLGTVIDLWGRNKWRIKYNLYKFKWNIQSSKTWGYKLKETIRGHLPKSMCLDGLERELELCPGRLSCGEYSNRALQAVQDVVLYFYASGHVLSSYIHLFQTCDSCGNGILIIEPSETG